MRPLDILARSFDGIRLNKLRVALTACAIAIGAFALMITFSLGEGARRASAALIASSINKQVISVTQKTDSANSATDLLKEYNPDATSQTGGIKLLKDSDIEKIAKLQGIKEVIRNYFINIEFLQSGDKKYAATVEQFKPQFAPELVAGSFSNGQLGTNQIIIPELYAKQLGFNTPQDAIGKTIKIDYFDEKHENHRTESFTIVAVSKKPLSTAALPSNFLISEAAAKRIYEYQITTDKNRGYTSADAIVKDGLTTEDIAIVKANIINAGYSAQTSEDSAKGINDIINGLQLFLTAFAAATLLAAVFGIINTEIIGILERKNEIGLLKAVGIHNRTLFTIFTVEAGWIGIFGTVLGISLAYIASLIANPLIAKQLCASNGRGPYGSSQNIACAEAWERLLSGRFSF